MTYVTRSGGRPGDAPSGPDPGAHPARLRAPWSPEEGLRRTIDYFRSGSASRELDRGARLGGAEGDRGLASYPESHVSDHRRQDDPLPDSPSAGRASVPGRRPRTPPSPGRPRPTFPSPAERTGRRPGSVPPVRRPPPGPPARTRTGPAGPAAARPRWGRIALVAASPCWSSWRCSAAVGRLALCARPRRRLARTDPFAEITGGRPAKAVNGALNILLVGSDSRDPDAPVDKPASGGPTRSSSCTSRPTTDRAYLVSIPRDLYVPIPEGAERGLRLRAARRRSTPRSPSAGCRWRCGRWSASPTSGIDHVMAIDFAGFKQVTDALGGVDLKVERTITSIHKPYRTFRKGMNHMNGAEALDWIRQRKQFPDGDFARMRHQQEFLRALMDKAASTGTLSNPTKLNAFLRATRRGHRRPGLLAGRHGARSSASCAARTCTS